MQQFYDNKTFLTWAKLNTHTMEDEPRTLSANAKISKWSTYVHKDPNYVPNLFMDNFSDSSNMFYCYGHSEENGKEFLVGVAIITPPLYKGNRANIDYILVDPRRQGQGYATRMIASISHNPEFFVQQGHTAGFQSIVKEDNVSAIMAHVNNNFGQSSKYTLNDKINEENKAHPQYSINGEPQEVESLPSYLRFFNNPTQKPKTNDDEPTK